MKKPYLSTSVCIDFISLIGSWRNVFICVALLNSRKTPNEHLWHLTHQIRVFVMLTYASKYVAFSLSSPKHEWNSLVLSVLERTCSYLQVVKFVDYILSLATKSNVCVAVMQECTIKEYRLSNQICINQFDSQINMTRSLI